MLTPTKVLRSEQGLSVFRKRPNQFDKIGYIFGAKCQQTLEHDLEQLLYVHTQMLSLILTGPGFAYMLVE